MTASFTCPMCGQVSSHPMDARFGWCARCDAFTGADDVRLAELVNGPELAEVSVNRWHQAIRELQQRRAHPSADQ